MWNGNGIIIIIICDKVWKNIFMNCKIKLKL